MPDGTGIFLIVGEDLDGCQYDFRQGCMRWFEQAGLKVKDESLSLWHFHEQWGMSKEEYDKLVDDGVDAGVIFMGKALPGSAYAAWKIRDLGHKLVIITHRWQGSPGNAERNTRAWLNQNYIAFDELIFSEDKTVPFTDMFVEDRVENYDALEANGTDAFLINQPWNEGRDTNGPRKRIRSMYDFAIAVEEKTKSG